MSSAYQKTCRSPVTGRILSVLLSSSLKVIENLLQANMLPQCTLQWAAPHDCSQLSQRSITKHHCWPVKTAAELPKLCTVCL